MGKQFSLPRSFSSSRSRSSQGGPLSQNRKKVMKHREHTSSTLTKGAALLTLLSVLLVPFSSTNAYFSDKESSLGNLFGASTLDMGLVVSGGGNERTFSVSNIGESPFEYDVRIVETSNPLASFCGGV